MAALKEKVTAKQQTEIVAKLFEAGYGFEYKSEHSLDYRSDTRPKLHYRAIAKAIRRSSFSLNSRMTKEVAGLIVELLKEKHGIVIDFKG